MSKTLLVLEESDFVEKFVGALANMHELSAVEWMQQSPSSPFQDIIRIETLQGAIFRLGLSWVEDEEVEEDFDEAFTQYLLQRSFQTLGCSCREQESQLEDLEIQLENEVLRFRLRLSESPLGEAIASLKHKITEIDRLEHPALDRMARDAYPYLEEWKSESLSPEIDRLGRRELIFRYAQQWQEGWRPIICR